MFILESDIVVYVDIDETLVSWTPQGWDTVIEIENNGFKSSFTPILANIEQVKKHKLCNHRVIFWSAGGWAWAKKVVEVLGLMEYADGILTKPRWIIDDLPASEFIPECNRIYKGDLNARK